MPRKGTGKGHDGGARAARGQGFDTRAIRVVPLPPLAGAPREPNGGSFSPGADPRRTPVADLNAARTRIREEERTRLEMEQALDAGPLPPADLPSDVPETPRASPELDRAIKLGVQKSFIRDIARGFLADPKYLTALAARLRDGRAPHMETLFHHYAYGRPATEVAISGMEKPRRFDLSKLSVEKVKEVLAILRTAQVEGEDEIPLDAVVESDESLG